MCVSIYFGYLMVFGGMVRIVCTSLWCIWEVVFLLSKTIVTFLMPFFFNGHSCPMDCCYCKIEVWMVGWFQGFHVNIHHVAPHHVMVT